MDSEKYLFFHNEENRLKFVLKCFDMLSKEYVDAKVFSLVDIFFHQINSMKINK